MRRFLAGLGVLFLLLAGAGGAQAGAAAEYGNLAWTIEPLTLFEGPGSAYDVTGSVDEAVRVRVERCQKLWCQIRTSGDRGWVPLHHLSFGKHPRGPLTGPRLNYASGGPGTVCFYEGHDFTGASLCGKSGFVVRDLLLLDLDNRYSSVAIEGNVSVLVCRDRFFLNYCERVTESGNLQGFLDNNVSSIRVY